MSAIASVIDALSARCSARRARHRANGDHLTASIKADRSILFDTTGAQIQ